MCAHSTVPSTLATWYEKLELLSLNADFVVNLVFAEMTGASMFCLGSSSALRRATLEATGGSKR